MVRNEQENGIMMDSKAFHFLLFILLACLMVISEVRKALLGFCPLSKQRCFTFDLRPGTVNENPRTGNPPAGKYHLWYSLSDINASNLLNGTSAFTNGRAVNPPHLQILRIDREGMIDDVIAWHMTSFVQKKKREKDVVGIITFDLIGLLPTNHIIAYITMAYWRLWGNSHSTSIVKQLKQHKIFEISLSESRIYKKWKTLAISR